MKLPNIKILFSLFFILLFSLFVFKGNVAADYNPKQVCTPEIQGEILKEETDRPESCPQQTLCHSRIVTGMFAKYNCHTFKGPKVYVGPFEMKINPDFEEKDFNPGKVVANVKLSTDKDSSAKEYNIELNQSCPDWWASCIRYADYIIVPALGDRTIVVVNFSTENGGGLEPSNNSDAGKTLTNGGKTKELTYIWTPTGFVDQPKILSVSPVLVKKDNPVDVEVKIDLGAKKSPAYAVYMGSDER